MKRFFLLSLVLGITLQGFTADKPAYILYNSDGKVVKYSKMLKALEDADIIFFGELHTDPIAHWMQFELTKELFNQKREALVLGAEMFESDNQLIFNEYLEGLYPADKFEAEMRLWKNYQTDYKPVVEFAKKHKIPFIATNIPRRYASMVFKGGFEALDNLTDEALRFIAPLPILYDPEVKCYKDMLDMGKMEAPAGMKKDTPGMVAPKGMPAPEMAAPKGMPAAHGKAMPKMSMENLPKAQAAKDATMAHFIIENWSAGKCLFHFNGSYHSDNHQGIVWHLQQENKDLKIITINTVLQEKIDTLSEDNLNSADYIICVPESMTRTGR
jgi:uncharacterized iron-regulated protein